MSHQDGLGNNGPESTRLNQPDDDDDRMQKKRENVEHAPDGIKLKKPRIQDACAIRLAHATAQQLCDALGACRDLHPVYRQLLKMALEELKLMDEQIDKLEQDMASLLSGHQDVVQRLAEVPGLGVDSAQQIIAEVG